MTEIKWLSLDNATATASTAEHGFVAKESKPAFQNEYTGNGSLCGKIFVCEDGFSPLPFDLIDGGKPEPSKNACKLCLKIYNKKAK